MHTRRACWLLFGFLAIGCNEPLIDPTDTALSDTMVAQDSADTDTDILDDGEVIVEDGMCAVTVTFDGAPAAQDVFVGGVFNEWALDGLPMMRSVTDSFWQRTLVLEPGDYAYKFVVNGAFEGELPVDALTTWNDGVENRRLHVPDCTRPTLEVLQAAVEGGRVKASFRFIAGQGGAALDPQSIQVTVARAAVTPTVSGDDGDRIGVDVDAGAFGKRTVTVTAADADGNVILEDRLFIGLWHEERTFEWQDAVVYLAFVDRFRDSDGAGDLIANVPERSNFLGGDFRGLVETLEDGYFEALGVNVLWLSPVYENVEGGFKGSYDDNVYAGYHGYWPTASDTAESRYGDADASADERLRELIDKAHDRGIRIVFDTVLNHVHEDHPLCAEPGFCDITCICGTDGCDWEGPSGRPLDCQFAPYLPDLNYRNQAVVNHMVEATLGWAFELDVDALRLDAVKHMDHVITRTLSLTLQARSEARGGAPFWLVGETFTGDEGRDLIMSYVSESELDGQFDFPLLGAIRSTFGGDGSFRDLEAATAASEQAYGAATDLMSPFVGNHDVPRIATVIAGNDGGPWGETADLMAAGSADVIDQWEIINRMSLSYAYLLGLRGVPLLYYGDEIGLAGAIDPDNRRTMVFAPDLNANQQLLLSRVQQLGQIRAGSLALRRGLRKELWLDDVLYVFARYTDAGDVAIVAMSKATTSRTEQVTLPPELGLADGTVLNSANSSRTMTVTGGQISLTLDPWEYMVVVHPSDPSD